MRHLTYKTKRDFLIKNNALKKQFWKLINKSISFEYCILKSFSYLYYKNFYKKINKLSKYRPKCLFSGRYRSTISMFSMSRMYFKKWALSGMLIGVKKASW